MFEKVNLTIFFFLFYCLKKLDLIALRICFPYGSWENGNHIFADSFSRRKYELKATFKFFLKKFCILESFSG